MLVLKYWDGDAIGGYQPTSRGIKPLEVILLTVPIFCTIYAISPPALLHPHNNPNYFLSFGYVK